MAFKEVTHVIFDLDGLLLDTEPLYEQAFEEVCNNFESKLTPEVRLKFLGTTERTSCEICVNELKLSCTVDEFERQLTETFHKIASQAKFLPGAERLINHFYSHNVPFCVASGSAGPGVELKIKNHQEIFKLFHHIVAGGTDPDVKEPKPKPDVFFVAAKRFDDKPETGKVKLILSNVLQFAGNFHFLINLSLMQYS